MGGASAERLAANHSAAGREASLAKDEISEVFYYFRDSLSGDLPFPTLAKRSTVCRDVSGIVVVCFAVVAEPAGVLVAWIIFSISWIIYNWP